MHDDPDSLYLPGITLYPFGKECGSVEHFPSKNFSQNKYVHIGHFEGLAYTVGRKRLLYVDFYARTNSLDTYLNTGNSHYPLFLTSSVWTQGSTSRMLNEFSSKHIITDEGKAPAYTRGIERHRYETVARILHCVLKEMVLRRKTISKVDRDPLGVLLGIKGEPKCSSLE